MAPKVSVILPSLNVASFIRECIESVIKQTLKDIEIICVDAGSTDGTLEILREYESKDPRIRVIISDKKSYGYQMNLGLDAATGQFLGIVETDDWVIHNMFEDLYNCATDNNLDFVKADFYRFSVNKDGSLNKTYNKLYWNNSFYGRVLTPAEEQETFRFIMNTWSGIYDIAFLRKWNIRHNETPGASYQDNGFWFQTFCRAERAFFVNTPYYMNRRDNQNSSVYSKGKVYCMRDEYDYIRNLIENDKERLAKFIPTCNFYRFCGYYYNTLFRIAPEYQREFLQYFSNEFRKLADRLELDRALFGQNEWRDLMQIMYAPDLFYTQRLLKPTRMVQFDYQYQPDVDGAPLVSVIVPVYNVEEYLPECLNTLLGQSLQNIEIICVNDGSTDESLEILHAHAIKDKRIRIINKVNGGLSSARNAGLSIATGKYVCFVDSDDGLAKNALERLVRAAEKENSDVVIFGFNPRHYPLYDKVPAWLETKNPVRHIVFHDFTADILFKEPGGKPLACRNMFKRSFLREHSLFFHDDCQFGEDTIFQFCAFPHAKNIQFFPKNLYYYRCSRADSLMSRHNDKLLLKCKSHVQIISYLCDYWKSQGWLNKMNAAFAAWALDFFFDVYNALNEAEKPECSTEFLKLIPSFCSNEHKLLGAGNRERLMMLRYTAQHYAPCEISQKSESFSPHEASKNPSVTFIVPVHNMEAYIERTVFSLLSQTVEDIEVICVDDASTDNTPQILADIMAVDKRLHVISYTENKTANQARKDGALAANGQYILFCDGDDFYAPHACECLLKEMEKKPVDILHFGTNVILNGGDEADKAWLDTNLRPFDGYLPDGPIFEYCFRNHLFGTSLWNKMYTTQLAKHAFSHIKDGRFPRGQDLYAFFHLAYFARSYRGISSLVLYNYNLNTGMDGTKELSPNRFSTFCSFPLVVNAMREFLEAQGVFEQYHDIWLDQQNKMLGDCVNKWYNKVSAQDKGVCFDIMCQAWPLWRLVESVSRRYWNNPGDAMRIFRSSQYRSVVNPNPKVIATYYHRMKNGGVENVMTALTSLWHDMGYKVVVITDIQNPSDFCELPEGIIRYAIPNEGAGQPYAYIHRARRLQEILEKEQVDTFVYHAWNTALMPWDMLLAKSLGCSFIVHCHGCFSLRLRDVSNYFADMPGIYGFADGIVCLSEADKYYWSHFNPNTFTVINPLLINIENTAAAECSGNTLLWIGRLSPEKHPEDALRVFADVHKLAPDATLLMVGSAESKAYEISLQKLAEKLGISNAVEWCGYQDNVTEYYQKASVFLMTSELEGFSLTLLEAMSHSLPIVMFELPYLALVQDNNGIWPIPQGNISAATYAIAELFANNDKRLAMSVASREFALNLSHYDYKSAWALIFASLATVRPEPDMNPAEQQAWDVFFDSYKYGTERIRRRFQSSQKERVEYNYDEINRIQASASYRIGRFITWPARKVRTFIRCIQEHGMKETIHIYLHRGK